MTAAWLILVMGGLGALMNYGAKAGTQEIAPPTWPADTQLSRHGGEDQLLVFLHPRCPCSRATVRQLERALVYSPRPVALRIVVFQPSDRADGWAKTSMVEAAAKLPGAEVTFDLDGAEARRFGAYTSGHVLLYDPHGRLVFSGGVTPARGHEGDSTGVDVLAAYWSGKDTEITQTQVYGCAIVVDPREGPQACVRKR